MREILLDTNFIIRCVKQKIDLFEDLSLMGFEIIIPDKIFNELNKIKNSKQKLHNKESAELSIKLIEKNNYKKIKLSGKTTDKAIINYAKKNPEIIIATLDEEIKKSVQNNKAIIRNLKKIEII